MRLTGLSEITAKVARASGANAADKIASPARTPATHADHGVGVATVLGSFEPVPAFETERIAEIRKAIKENRYPLVPARIADALIAAKLFGIIEA